MPWSHAYICAASWAASARSLLRSWTRPPHVADHSSSSPFSPPLSLPSPTYWGDPGTSLFYPSLSSPTLRTILRCQAPCHPTCGELHSSPAETTPWRILHDGFPTTSQQKQKSYHTQCWWYVHLKSENETLRHALQCNAMCCVCVSLSLSLSMMMMMRRDFAPLCVLHFRRCILSFLSVCLRWRERRRVTYTWLWQDCSPVPEM